MKLTNYMRDFFVESVLKSLKNVDYREKYQSILQEDAIKQLPEKLQDKSLHGYLESERIYINDFGCMGSVYVKNNKYKPSDEIKEKLKFIHADFEKQRNLLASVRGTVRALIYRATTVEKAKLILDESLHKYLPVKQEIADPINALATTELMDNLKILGLK